MKNVLSKVISSWIFAIIMSILLCMVAVIWFGPASYHVDGFTLGLSVKPAVRGATELAIQPFGDIKAYTHKSPVLLRVAFERVIPGEIEKVAGTIMDSEQLVDKIQQEGMSALRLFVLRLILLAGIGGAIGASISTRRRVRKAIAGFLIGLALMGSVLGLTYRSYDVYAFKQPQYSGMLAAAPWATEEVAKRLADIKAFRKEFLTFANNINQFYTKIDAWQPIKRDSVLVLHVSDIHNNPLAIDLIRRIVRDFGVDMVIDTGDITDLGTPIETTLVKDIGELPVPYIYIPGNHDSQASVSAMKSDKNVVVLESKAITVKGLKIFGIADPSAQESDPNIATATTILAVRSRIRADFKGFSQKPMIVAIHNPNLAEPMVGLVPLILVGHTHRANDKVINNTVLDNAGSSGGEGVRSIVSASNTPYTFKLIYIDKKKQKLIAIDSLELTGAEQEFKLERRLFEGKYNNQDE